jgi:hypothetical protein
MQAARRGEPLTLPVSKVLAEEDATFLLAQYADCMQPARIVLLVDQVLHHNTHQPSGSVVWIMSVVRHCPLVLLGHACVIAERAVVSQRRRLGASHLIIEPP